MCGTPVFMRVLEDSRKSYWNLPKLTVSYRNLLSSFFPLFFCCGDTLLQRPRLQPSFRLQEKQHSIFGCRHPIAKTPDPVIPIFVISSFGQIAETLLQFLN